MARPKWGSHGSERRRLTVRNTHDAAGEEIDKIVNSLSEKTRAAGIKAHTVWSSAFERRLRPRNLSSRGGSEGGQSPPPSLLTRPAVNETRAITTGPSRADAEPRFADLDPDRRTWGASSMAAT
jgi:hypothetical protein